jgi:hypothetical protein
MVIAMTAVGVMQVAFHHIVDVVAMRDRLMAAARIVLVVLGMSAAIVLGRAVRGILAADSQTVFLDALGAHMVQMAVVKVINVTIMFDGRVPTSRAMLVIVLGMKGSSHARPPFFDTFRFQKNALTL